MRWIGQGVEDAPLAAGGVAVTQLDEPGNSNNGQEDPEREKVSRDDLISRSGSPERDNTSANHEDID